MARARSLSLSLSLTLALTLTISVLAIDAPVSQAKSDSSELGLKSGDRLQSNAWRCATAMRQCSWATSAKLLGGRVKDAKWIENRTEIKVKGVRASITLGQNRNVKVTFRSRKTIRARWRNTKAWISDSSGKVGVKGALVGWVTAKSHAYAYHPRFGRPGPVEAYVGFGF